MKILEIGPGNMPVADQIWTEEKYPGRIIETVEAVEDFDTTYHFDARKPPEEMNGQYDAVIASHVYEHIAFFEGREVLQRWVDFLKPGGQMHIIVPSGEWVALQLMLENPSPMVQAQIHGLHTTEYDVHRATYTLRGITGRFRQVGLAVTHASTDVYTIRWGNKAYEAEQHYIRGVKIGKEEAA